MGSLTHFSRADQYGGDKTTLPPLRILSSSAVRSLSDITRRRRTGHPNAKPEGKQRMPLEGCRRTRKARESLSGVEWSERDGLLCFRTHLCAKRSGAAPSDHIAAHDTKVQAPWTLEDTGAHLLELLVAQCLGMLVSIRGQCISVSVPDPCCRQPESSTRFYTREPLGRYQCDFIENSLRRMDMMPS